MAEYVAKQQFLDDMTSKMKDVLTVTEMEKMQSVMLSVLSSYNVERTAADDAAEASQDFLEMFLDAKNVEGRSEKTLARYRFILNRFFHVENVTAQGTNVYHIRDYFMREKKRGMADGTIAGYRDVFNSFFGWLTNEGLIPRNPCANVGTIKQEKKVRKPFSAVEVKKMLDSCQCIRDKAIIQFLLSTGCRISEVCGLHIGDIDLNKRESVVYGKGRKERTVFFDDVTQMLLGAYFFSREDNSKEASLFVTESRGFPMSPNEVRKMMKELEKISGVENIHPHRFRRTLATNLINKGMPIQEVAAILGHTKVDTTMKYVYQSAERTKAAYERFTA